ncbi:MAG: hypothetical protein ABEH43_11030, partial [Flavobacteriales bacterium]
MDFRAKTFLLLFLLLYNVSYSQQNLVPNGSFEKGGVVDCHNNCDPEYSYVCSGPDHWHTSFKQWNAEQFLLEDELANSGQNDCCDGWSNRFGVQIAIDGNNYVGIRADNLTSQNNIWVKLKQNLGCGEVYRLDFDVAHIDLKPQGGPGDRCGNTILSDFADAKLLVDFGENTGTFNNSPGDYKGGEAKKVAEFKVENEGGLSSDNWRHVSRIFTVGGVNSPVSFKEAKEQKTPCRNTLIFRVDNGTFAPRGVYIDNVSIKKVGNNKIPQVPCSPSTDCGISLSLESNPKNSDAVFEISKLNDVNRLKYTIVGPGDRIYASPNFYCKYGITTDIKWSGTFNDGNVIAPSSSFVAKVEAANECGSYKEYNQKFFVTTNNSNPIGNSSTTSSIPCIKQYKPCCKDE